MTECCPPPLAIITLLPLRSIWKGSGASLLSFANWPISPYPHAHKSPPSRLTARVKAAPDEMDLMGGRLDSFVGVGFSSGYLSASSPNCPLIRKMSR